MIKHIVFFKINTQNKSGDLIELKKMIENLGSTIPSIVSIEAGINFSPRDTAYDIALFATFRNKKGLSDYQEHPEHLKLIQHLKQLNRELVVVDYEL